VKNGGISRVLKKIASRSVISKNVLSNADPQQKIIPARFTDDSKFKMFIESVMRNVTKMQFCINMTHEHILNMLPSNWI